MQIRRFQAHGVHGHLDFSIQFDPQLSFLIGLNGSGKTSALRLIMGLLAPNFEELARLEYHWASVTVGDTESETTIRADNSGRQVTLSVAGASDFLVLTNEEIGAIGEYSRHGEIKPGALDKIFASEVFKIVDKLPTPMFLGVDRRNYRQEMRDDEAEARRRELRRRPNRLDELRHHEQAPTQHGLLDVGLIIQSAFSDLRFQQERLDREFKEALLVELFKYQTAKVSFEAPSLKNIISEQEIAAAVKETQLPREVHNALSSFLAQLTTLTKKLAKTSTDKADISDAQITWLVNRSQAERILRAVELLKQHAKRRREIAEPVDRFLRLVNGFFAQTGKNVAISERGELFITRLSDSKQTPLSALASGERQLLVMLAHLSFNEKLHGSGIFIIDEPELSLHIDWQERFVSSMIEANSNVQFVLATHSPAIILDRDDHCRQLREANN